jgi:hypothetical protein
MARAQIDAAVYRRLTPVDHLFREGRLLILGIPARGVLVQTLLDRGADGDVDEAAITRLADAPADDGLVIRKTGCYGGALCWPCSR